MRIVNLQMCILFAIVLLACSADNGNESDVKPGLGPAFAQIIPCSDNTAEQCIQITLPCTDESVYGKAGWYGHACEQSVIEIPNGRPIYALLVSGFQQNRDFNLFHFYNFARCLMKKGAYVHYAWWNNLLAPYMAEPLHNPDSVPSIGALTDTLHDYLGFLYDPDADPFWKLVPDKAIPAEDYQFQEDAGKMLTAIRYFNPDASIVLVGHSMGGDAVVRLGANTEVDIALLAPIDAVGNRTCLSNETERDPVHMNMWNTKCDGAYNFTRFQATHTDWYWLPYRIRYDSNINYLYYRWQNEFLPPFDWGCPNYVLLCPLQLHMLAWIDVWFRGVPADEVSLPDAYLFRHPNTHATDISEGSSNVQERVVTSTSSGYDAYPNNSGGAFDGHGEIVGFRGVIPGSSESNPIGLAAQNGWPYFECGITDIDQPDDVLRAKECRKIHLNNWEADPDYLDTKTLAPQKPEDCSEPDSDYCTYCMVSGDLCTILATLDLMPVADAGPDQIIECSSAYGTPITLDGSGSHDPNNDALTYTWTGPFGTVMGDIVSVELPMGSHTITLTVKDSEGNTDVDTVVVNVSDSIAPTLYVSLSPDTLWPPNHKMVEISADIQVNDSCDNNPVVTLRSITSNEPDNGMGDGDTANDIQGASLGSDDREFFLRAERSGQGSGRIYTVTYDATDGANNTAEPVTAKVTVLHNR